MTIDDLLASTRQRPMYERAKPAPLRMETDYYSVHVYRGETLVASAVRNAWDAFHVPLPAVSRGGPVIRYRNGVRCVEAAVPRVAWRPYPDRETAVWALGGAA